MIKGNVRNGVLAAIFTIALVVVVIWLFGDTLAGGPLG